MNTATVVTCYYKIASKHSHNEYDIWMTNFLSNIDCQLVIFTSPDLVEYIKNKQGVENLKTIKSNSKNKNINRFNNYEQFIMFSKTYYKYKDDGSIFSVYNFVKSGFVLTVLL